MRTANAARISVPTVFVGALALAAAVFGAGPAFAAGGGIEIMPTPAKLLPLILLFVLMIVPVNRLIIQPMLSVLDERDARIAGARQRAAELEKRASEVLASCEASVATAREEAESDRRGTLDQARSAHAERVGRERGEAEARIAEARREVGSALEAARSGLQAEAQELARQAAERMLGRSLS